MNGENVNKVMDLNRKLNNSMSQQNIVDVRENNKTNWEKAKNAASTNKTIGSSPLQTNFENKNDKNELICHKKDQNLYEGFEDKKRENELEGNAQDDSIGFISTNCFNLTQKDLSNLAKSNLSHTFPFEKNEVCKHINKEGSNGSEMKTSLDFILLDEQIQFELRERIEFNKREDNTYHSREDDSFSKNDTSNESNSDGMSLEQYNDSCESILSEIDQHSDNKKEFLRSETKFEYESITFSDLSINCNNPGGNIFKENDRLENAAKPKSIKSVSYEHKSTPDLTEIQQGISRNVKPAKKSTNNFSNKNLKFNSKQKVETQQNKPKSFNKSSLSPQSYHAQKKLTLYKTEICRSFEETQFCRYGSKCQFAHNKSELRVIDRHPRYKTEICKTYWVEGTCPYGRRCCFIHKDEISQENKEINNVEVLEQEEKQVDLDLSIKMTSIEISDEKDVKKEVEELKLEKIVENDIPSFLNFLKSGTQANKEKTNGLYMFDQGEVEFSTFLFQSHVKNTKKRGNCIGQVPYHRYSEDESRELGEFSPEETAKFVTARLFSNKSGFS